MIDGDFHHALERRAGGLEDCLQILADLPRLGPDAALGQRARLRIDAELAGDEQPVAGLDGLRERDARRRNPIGVNDLLAHGALLPR
jgi:hypothetical protein